MTPASQVDSFCSYMIEWNFNICKFLCWFICLWCDCTIYLLFPFFVTSIHNFKHEQKKHFYSLTVFYYQIFQQANSDNFVCPWYFLEEFRFYFNIITVKIMLVYLPCWLHIVFMMAFISLLYRMNLTRVSALLLKNT